MKEVGGPLGLVTDSKCSVFGAASMIACFKYINIYIYFKFLRVLEKVLPNMSELNLTQCFRFITIQRLQRPDGLENPNSFL